MRILRACLAVFALFIVVCVIAFACLIIFIDPNQLKPVLAQEIKKTTGYQLAIEGDLTWTFYPRIGVKVKHMTLSEPNQSKPFLDLKDVRIAAKLVELIQAKLKTNNLVGKVYIEEMNLNNVNAKQVKAELHWQNNMLTLQPIKASFYQGTLEGFVRGNPIATLPHWDFEIKLHQIEIQPLLKELSESNSKLMLSGLGELTFSGKTEGSTKENMLSKLSGSLEFKLSHGVVDGINLNYIIQTLDALLAKKPTTISLSDSDILLGQTIFDDFSASVAIESGLARTQNLTLKAPTFIATGKGSVALVSQQIDLELDVRAEQNVVSSEQLKSFVIPVIISGTLNKPDVHLNMTEIQKLAVKEQIDKVKTKAREMIKEHVPGKAGDFLKNLLGD